MHIVLVIIFFIFLFFKPQQTIKYFLIPSAVISFFVFAGFLWLGKQAQEQEAKEAADYEQLEIISRKIDAGWKDDPVECSTWQAVADNVRCAPPSGILRANYLDGLPKSKVDACADKAQINGGFNDKIYVHCTGWDIAIKKFSN